MERTLTGRPVRASEKKREVVPLDPLIRGSVAVVAAAAPERGARRGVCMSTSSQTRSTQDPAAPPWDSDSAGLDVRTDV